MQELKITEEKKDVMDVGVTEAQTEMTDCGVKMGDTGMAGAESVVMEDQEP